MPVKITYFVHGTTTDNENGISTGWNQGDLSELGKRQSMELKNLIKGEKFDVVFSSDLERAVDSANLAFGRCIQDKRLRECNYGDYNGASSGIVERMAEKCVEKSFPNGESYMDVEKRMRSFLDDLKKKYQDKCIAIVSHRGPQLALDVILKGKTWKQAFREDWRLKKEWKPGWDYVF